MSGRCPDLRCSGDAFFRESGKAIIALTVREILDKEIARKVV